MAEADLNQKLQRLHEAVVDTVLDQLEHPTEAGISNDDLRVALALLKQNGVTAPVAEGSRMDQASKLAGKLNFQGLAEKRQVVVPIRPGIEPSAS
jgi:hypothetical protein